MKAQQAKEMKMANAQEAVFKIKEICKSPIIARDAVQELTGGLVNPRTLSNHDSAGTGPKGLFYIGRRVAYPTEAFCDWLANRVRLEPEQRGGRKA